MAPAAEASGEHLLGESAPAAHQAPPRDRLAGWLRFRGWLAVWLARLSAGFLDPRSGLGFGLGFLAWISASGFHLLGFCMDLH